MPNAAKAAIWYARRGWYVFPLLPGTKEPRRGSRGLLEATLDLATIGGWWRENPEYNIGLACGPSGIVALDVDPKNGGNLGLVKSLYGEMATETVTNLTPSGGMHYLYAAGEVEIRNSAGKLAPGLDIRGVGGYIVVPPSIVNGTAYAWEVECGPHECEISAIPAAIITALAQNSAKPLAQSTVIELIPSGQRNQHLTAMAGRLRRHGLSAQEIEAALQTANTARCRPPLAQGEVASIARSIARYEPADPLEIGPSSSGVMSFDQLAALGKERMDWFVEGLLRESGAMLLASRPKVGKSDLARNLARCVALGEPFLGRRCKQGSVLWIGLEEPVSHLLERIEVLKMQDLPINWVVQQPTGDKTLWLATVVREYKPDLVIIDTIGRFADIEDINNYSQVTRATQPILNMRTEFGTTFVILHHNNAMNATLGSTMWEGVVDTIMSITANADESRFVKTKQRSGVNMEATAITLDRDTGIISAIESKELLDQRMAEQRILAYVSKREGPFTREELSKHCGRSVAIGRAAVDSLAAFGHVIMEGTGTKADPRVYRVSRKSHSCSPIRSPIKESHSLETFNDSEYPLEDSADLLFAYAEKRINEI